MQVHVINPSGELDETETTPIDNTGHRREATIGWAKRRGLDNEQAEDFADYYQNPHGWFGEPQRTNITQLKSFANKLGLQATSEEITEAVENTWFGENPKHRIEALAGWANRNGLNPKDANEFAEFVENHQYGDPEAHRRASMKGWMKRNNNNENPVTGWMKKAGETIEAQFPLLPGPYNEHLGVSEVIFSPSWEQVGGVGLGVVDTMAYSGLGEYATENDWAGNFIGLGAGLGTSAVIRAIPYGKQGLRDEIARGQRFGAGLVFLIRTVSSIIKWNAGVKSPSAVTGSLSDGLDDVVARIKEGKVIEAFKTPFMTGLGLNGLKEALPELQLPELDITKMKAWVKRGVSGAVPEDLAITQQNEQVAISAKDEQLTISAGAAGEQLAVS